MVVDPDEVKDDLVQDVMDALTSMCARLYGRRSARHRAEKALKAASKEVEEACGFLGAYAATAGQGYRPRVDPGAAREPEGIPVPGMYDPDEA